VAFGGGLSDAKILRPKHGIYVIDKLYGITAKGSTLINFGFIMIHFLLMARLTCALMNNAGIN
jgi:hypothetical protein